MSKIYHPGSTDEKLRQGCLRQHPLAQKYLYERYFGRLLGIAMRYTSDREEALSVLNQAFLKIFSNINQYSGAGSFIGWMAKIVLHTAIDHVRSQVTYRRVMDFHAEADNRVSNEGLSQLQAEDLFRIIQQLPPATRTVFNLYVIDGYKHSEIAEMLNIDEGTSKWHLFQARRLLQQRLRCLYEPAF
ncbi:MAG: RNA polymerase sigma factor [Saprospiraceae bacterium]|nr:RNA polymerase sigma factor [Saprospiraceae bacterium]MDW8483916.1 RNA polymerase sigma factor [Saprospiraceae bacterium]